MDCSVWTPAIQQDKLDKFLSPSESIRSLEIRNWGGTSPEVINEFLHRLLSQDMHVDGLDKFSLSISDPNVAKTLDQ